MSRRFKTANYEETLNQNIGLADALPPHHWVRIMVGEPIAQEVLSGLLFCGHVTELFSSHKVEKAKHEHISFRFIARGWYPNNRIIANFRKTFLAVIKELFVQFLMIRQVAGLLKLGNIIQDSNKIHAEASRNTVVSYECLSELETHLCQEVVELFVLGVQVDQGEQHLLNGMEK